MGNRICVRDSLWINSKSLVFKSNMTWPLAFDP